MEAITDLTPEESNVALTIATALMRKYSSQPFTQARAMQLENEAAARFAAVGLVVTWDWGDQEPDGSPSSDRVWFMPQLIIEGRTEVEVLDHDAIRAQVVSGLAGGFEGYVREDGTIHEDPIKKNVY